MRLVAHLITRLLLQLGWSAGVSCHIIRWHDWVDVSKLGTEKDEVRSIQSGAVTTNYEAICEENLQRYGWDVSRYGKELLADRYDDRTHFIFELLQNAEDALSRRGDWKGPRRVTFRLTPTRLTLSHFGRPFDEADVLGVCGIAESTKDKFSIGRFGIGFKSVYTFTDRPEIHSGNEDFAVENYVQPRRVERAVREADETQIVLPLKAEDKAAQPEITTGFRHLGPGALLFLRHIDEINWSVEGGASGFYQRSAPESLGANVHRITVIGQESGQPEVDQNWLVFHRDAFSAGQEKVGRVEVAFSLQATKDRPSGWAVVAVVTSPLVVFFPTAVETNLGFLVQGPYRTTPSRDNIPRHDPWNKHLVELTADLLVEAMRWLCDQGAMDVSALHCLPLDREKFPDGAMFGPVFAAVRQALSEEPLLPRFDDGYVAASRSKLARTQELRELFSPQQVAQLYGTEEAAWLSGDITQDRAPEIRQYVMRELGVAEVTPESIVPHLTQSFLEAQSDDWISRLYEFLSGQPALMRRLDSVPLVRLSDGSHVVARVGGEPQAFLPSNIETGFPTVGRAVCSSSECRMFLKSLGITEPDPVDDVILNVLQKYRSDSVDVDDDQYAKDIQRILAAFSTDSKTQREKLLAALREITFVKVVDAGDGTGYVDRPGNVYIATDRLKQLFAGVPGVMIVDDAYDCLRGESVRELLEACGAVRYPRPLEAPHAMSYEERRELRRKAGHEGTSGVNDQVVDWLLQGFDKVVEVLLTLPVEQRAERARLLWESLGDLEERRGRGIFVGSYQWTHYGSYKIEFPAIFVRRLNEAAWVPDANREPQPPRLVIFDNLGWERNPFLLTKIEFKPPIIDQLAKEAGIDPAALDLLRKLNITSVAALISRLGIPDLPPESGDKSETESETDTPSGDGGDVYVNAKDLYGDDMPNIPSGTPDPDGGSDVAGGAPGREGRSGVGSGGASGGGKGNGGSQSGSVRSGDRSGNDDGTGGGQGNRSPGQAGGRPFISYVGTHPDEGELDPDGLDQAARMRIEEQAIELITRLEPTLRHTPDGNPGFDLYEIDGGGKPVRWVEVKSMTGSLEDRPVGLSRTQFDCANQRGAGYWLYVVEYATDPAKARVLRIQDPVGHAKTFTFDRGWVHIARTEPPD
ncbi:MAG: sacsin N-terminal ATP-binding-like domain-containing protein [Acidobacteriaceae bacterium]